MDWFMSSMRWLRSTKEERIRSGEEELTDEDLDRQLDALEIEGYKTGVPFNIKHGGNLKTQYAKTLRQNIEFAKREAMGMNRPKKPNTPMPRRLNL